MLRAGLIKQLASGLYTWMPFGLRVLKKVEAIVREEMENIGAQELLMPMVQPADLWVQSKRWEQYGPELLRMKDRHARDFCLGPTHEEVICDIASQELQSYKDLPATYFQIQTKFRDEIRPRFGIIRTREFLMKDAYSFHESQSSLDSTYDAMRSAYSTIITRLCLDFRIVAADSGAIGGNLSEEFHVLAESGEDLIAFDKDTGFACNIETIELPKVQIEKLMPSQAMDKISTQDIKTIDGLINQLNIKPNKIIKTILVKGTEENPVALLIRGDRTLNVLKAERLPFVSKPLTFLKYEEIKSTLNTSPGFIGPVSISLTTYADYETQNINHFICGANEDHFHLKNVCWERDLPLPTFCDLRNAEDGDIPLNSTSNNPVKLARGIEVGHIFQLGDKYTREMNITVNGESANEVIPLMGCYGIGIGRMVAAIIEQMNDEKGIIWPSSVAPFDIAILPILGKDNKNKVGEAGLAIYEQLATMGKDVLYDDRDIRPGGKFADSDLLGIPLRLVISEKLLDQGLIEIKERTSSEATTIPLDKLEDFIIHFN
jgi:prolyl-tRNA synthetase